MRKLRFRKSSARKTGDDVGSVSGNAAKPEKVYKHIIRRGILSVRYDEVAMDADPGVTAKRLSSSQRPKVGSNIGFTLIASPKQQNPFEFV